MIVRTLLVALVAGLIAGVFMTGLQQLRLVPLILEAETYEGASGPHEDHAAVFQHPVEALAQYLLVTPAHAHSDNAEEEAGGTLFGLDRFSGTLLANLVAGAGFGLLMAGVSVVIGHPLTAANGLIWGSLGWLAVHLLPSLGLPPELPGFPAADLTARQIWWIATVFISAVGLGMLALRRESGLQVGGLLLIVLPHLWGAPQPSDIASPVPAVLGAEFAVAALGTTLAFWLVLGLVSGWINVRYGKAA
ncbi:CbtA family protein [Rhizobium sp. CC-YZS058]|uniref:CbtA family protein n=1 Tax=Rhizobium sp. CC-YZS058 TaxID=3042153 RepID=UPI002B059CF6|nr:CbtA family protein [Rhizobium sp. CC-YZS058]MEA3533240.1 CbtA family protein [Rhizobium sp. CC-YZS058]